MPTYQFGVSIAGLSTYGQEQSFEETDSQSVAEVKDANGDIHETVAYGDNMEECSAEVIEDTTAADTAAGSEITLGGKTYIVTERTISQENESYRKRSIKGRRKVTAGTPA